MKIKNTIFGLTVAAILAGGCSFLDPLPDGSYNDENFGDYPELLRGFVDKAYADYFPAVYYSTYCAGLAAAQMTLFTVRRQRRGDLSRRVTQGWATTLSPPNGTMTTQPSTI